jgi:formylglycine-generating enzyme required for sulfatase activity
LAALRHPAFPDGVDHRRVIEWFREGRRRSAEVFAIPRPEAYYDRPIALRNPVVFYEGHLPAFNINTLIKLTMGRPGIDESYEVLFARGIDPESEDAAKSPTDVWPSRQCVQKYGRESDAMIEAALESNEIGEATFAILEHEQMHQETLLYMFHEMPYERKMKRPPLASAAGRASATTPAPERVSIPSGEVTVGTAPNTFGWDNEFPQHRVAVDAFEIDTFNVTNGQYLEYLQSTDADPPHFWVKRDGEWFWRGMFELIPLPLDWPVYVSHDEAGAYAAWRGGRLPSEAEYHRAAFGTPSGEQRVYPWGDEQPDGSRGNFGFTNWDPVAVGSYPGGASAWGVHDLVGNGWEWTSTIFEGFEGFRPMKSYPVYSSDFFDGQHYVLKGASPATATQLVRPGFRNWFRPNYPYVYATFRLVS